MIPIYSYVILSIISWCVCFAFTVWLKSECNFLAGLWLTDRNEWHTSYLHFTGEEELLTHWILQMSHWYIPNRFFFFCLIRLGHGQSGAADNGKLQTFLIDLQSFDFREFKSINFNAVFRIGLRRESRVRKVKKNEARCSWHNPEPSQTPWIIELQLNILIIVIMLISTSKWGLSL